MHPKEIVGIAAIIIIAVYALWIIFAITHDRPRTRWSMFGQMMRKPKKAEDYLRPTSKEELSGLWRKGYEIGFCEKALVPKDEIPYKAEAWAEFMSEEEIKNSLKLGESIKMGQKDGQAYREAHASPDPVTRYLESVDSIYEKESGNINMNRVKFVGDFSEEFIPHIEGLDGITLAKLLRDRRVGCPDVLSKIHNEITARILEKL